MFGLMILICYLLLASAFVPLTDFLLCCGSLAVSFFRRLYAFWSSSWSLYLDINLVMSFTLLRLRNAVLY